MTSSKSPTPSWWNPRLGFYREWLQQLIIYNEESVMRRYIRHPSEIPLQFQISDSDPPAAQHMRDVSEGGLCFTADRPLACGTWIHINIPVMLQPDVTQPQPFEADGVVAWCRREGQSYAVGVQFADQSTQFGVRMVEQVCHIEHYRYDVLQEEGRALSSEEAAREWVERYAAEFPQ
jgi:hypothetical protein